MPDDESKKLNPVNVLLGALVIASLIGVIIYNRMQIAELLDSPAVVQKVVASSALTHAIERQVGKSLSAADLRALLGESAELQSLVSNSVSDQMDRFGTSNAFRQAVIAALPEQPKITDNSGKINQLQSKLTLYETRLTHIAARVNDDESAQTVNQLQGQLVELQQLIGGLSAEVHCSLTLPTQSRSNFLLKERRSTNLRAYDLVVTLGRIKKDIIDSVTLSAPNAERSQVNTRVVGNVKLGNSLEFQSGGHSYEGVFTYRQARFGPDFVGFEVTETVRSPEDCLQTQGIAAL